MYYNGQISVSSIPDNLINQALKDVDNGIELSEQKILHCILYNPVNKTLKFCFEMDYEKSIEYSNRQFLLDIANAMQWIESDWIQKWKSKGGIIYNG